VSPKATLSAADLQQVMFVYHRLIGEHRDHLNALNVYPVPDADTGINLYSTLGGVVEALPDVAEDDMARVCSSIRKGAMLGARGCSGVITSQLLGALVGSLGGAEDIDGPALAAGLGAATEAAYRAVLRPVEGTILTVLREAAQAAGTVADGSLVEVLDAARAAAGAALERTPEQLPQLKAAGVVDAGGSGLVLFLDSLLHVVDQRPLPEPPLTFAGQRASEMPDDMPRYEVVVRLEAPAEVMGEFRAVWERLGNESTMLVDSGGDWVCHIHTNHRDAAIEAARAAGVVHDLRVTDMAEQMMQLRTVHSDRVAVVVVAAGSGLQDRFLEMGASGVVAGGATKNPSTAELLQAVESTGAGTVIVLPNDENVTPAAEQVAGLTERRVVVVPTLSIPGGLAAMRRFDPARPDSTVETMASAGRAVHSGGVTMAVRDADSPLGRIAAGTWIVRPDDGPVSTSPSMPEALIVLIDYLVGDGSPSRIEIIAGAGSDAEATDRARRHVAARWPNAESTVIDGGQPHYPYLVGVEAGMAGEGH
jgi:DAK2 domain fusion protein YloV